MIRCHIPGLVVAAFVVSLLVACGGSPEPVVTAKMLAPELVADKLRRQQQLPAASDSMAANSQILFGDSDNPDTVAFLGWEWSQVNNMDRNKHYGHKNVIFLDTAEDKVPTRSIAAPRKQLNKSPIGKGAQYALVAMDWKNRNLYLSIDD